MIQNARRNMTMPTPANARVWTRDFTRDSPMSFASVIAGIPEAERAVPAGGPALVGGDDHPLLRRADLVAERGLGGPAGDETAAEERVEDDGEGPPLHSSSPPDDAGAKLEFCQRRRSNAERAHANRN